MEKRCGGCKEYKFSIDFNKNQNYCKECQSQHNKQWMSNNRDTKLKHRRKYRRKHHQKILNYFRQNKDKMKAWREQVPISWRAFWAVSNNARKKKVDCCSKTDFIKWYNNQNKICIYCGITEKDFVKVNKIRLPYQIRLEVDRKISKDGYIIKNLCLACRDCNTVKSCVLSFDEMRFIGEKFIRPKHIEALNHVNSRALRYRGQKTGI